MKIKNSAVVILSFFLIFNFSFFISSAQDTTAVCPEFIEEKNNHSLLNVFPNPSNGTFQITYASSTTCPPDGWGGLMMINIINENGKTVYSETISDFEGEYNQTIDLSTEKKGVYIIEIVSGKQKKMKREVLN